MFKLNISAVCLLIVLFTACSKDDRVALADRSVSIQLANGLDTLQTPMTLDKDSTIVLDLKAALKGEAASNDHWVTFAVDTTRMLEYRSKYGDAMLLPTSCYLLFKPDVRIASGSSVSEAAQFNIGHQTRLVGNSIYVLPVVIKTVDGKEDFSDNRTVYLVFKTAQPKDLDRVGWEIAGYSTQLSSTNAAAKTIDVSNTTTFWASALNQPMPQWISIDFKKDIIFSSLKFYIPTTNKYPNNGAYPTSVKIETSMDGTIWVNKGVFAGDIVDYQQTINLGITTARYVRFTVLSAAKYTPAPTLLYETVFISGIVLRR
ncbi:discoidin domain-containing protein [Pararcticibacter amylolyticus]|uniref:discoidin domain-containing protein n=1 Tax=Pararcticibacter amylolyticus TaxID=2173175 RepID=UPI001EE4C836|nr:discoidin domain-containing protein [Pararcticibacter amylolyticus]